MNLSSLNVLVISFYFPPYSKVGGRRWAKHCKYLYKKNVDFHVLAGNFEGDSSWDKDIEPFSDRITRIKITRKNFPYYKRTLPQNIIQKIAWKLSYWNWEIIKNKLRGNYNDVSAGNEKQFYEAASFVIRQQKINTVILSGGPFAYSKILLKIKAEFPDIRLIIDYRDYWEDGFSGLSPKQVRYEKNLQEKVIRNIDLLLSPNEEMDNYYSSTFKKQTYVLPHCIDSEDFSSLPKSEIKLDNSEIKLIYGGAFYHKINENIEVLKKLISELNKTRAVRTEFYVSTRGYEAELNHPLIKRSGFIISEQFFHKVLSNDYVILILPPDRVNAMSSKFYELIALRKPILYFGGRGIVSGFLIKNKLGFHITEENFIEQTKNILNNLNTRVIPDLDFDISNRQFDFQTDLLVNQLHKI